MTHFSPEQVRELTGLRSDGSSTPTPDSDVDAFADFRSSGDGSGGWWSSDVHGHSFPTLRAVLMDTEVDGKQGLRRRAGASRINPTRCSCILTALLASSDCLALAETMLPDSQEIRTTKEELVDSLVECFTVKTWSGDRKSQALFFNVLASGTLLPPPGSGKPWSLSRWAIVFSFLGMAVMSAVARAIKFGRESWVEFEHDEPYASFIDGTLCVASIFVSAITPVEEDLSTREG